MCSWGQRCRAMTFWKAVQSWSRASNLHTSEFLWIFSFAGSLQWWSSKGLGLFLLQVLVMHSKQTRKRQKSGSRQSKRSTADILHSFALKILVQKCRRGKMQSCWTDNSSHVKAKNPKQPNRVSGYYRKKSSEKEENPGVKFKSCAITATETFYRHQVNEDITVQNESQLKRSPSKTSPLLLEKHSLPEK